MSRNFGNPSGPTLGGNEQLARSHGLRGTRADPYPLPAGSVLGEGFSPDERTKGRAALSFAVVVFTLWFAIPLIVAGIMLRFH